MYESNVHTEKIRLDFICSDGTVVCEISRAVFRHDRWWKRRGENWGRTLEVEPAEIGQLRFEEQRKPEMSVAIRVRDDDDKGKLRNVWTKLLSWVEH